MSFNRNLKYKTHKYSDMRKSLKFFLLATMTTILLSVALFVLIEKGAFRPHHKMAIDPLNIDKITGVILPYAMYSTLEDNLDRVTSRWDTFYREMEFADSLTDEQKNQLDKLCAEDPVHWVKELGPRLCYEYLDDAWGTRGDCYTICCRIYEDRASCEYMVDEDEGIVGIAVGVMIILLLLASLAIWGLVLVIVAIVRRRKPKVQ